MGRAEQQRLCMCTCHSKTRPPTGNVEDKKGRLVSFVLIWDREGEQFTSTLNLVSVFAHCVCLRVSVNVRAGSIPTPWSRAVWRSDHT